MSSRDQCLMGDKLGDTVSQAWSFTEEEHRLDLGAWSEGCVLLRDWAQGMSACPQWRV